MKYLGGITFLLKDACPEDSPASARTTYQQCAATEALHVSPSVRGERRVTVWLDPVCHWQTQDWRQAHRASLHGPLLRRLLGGERRQDPRLSLQWEEVHTVRQSWMNFLNLQMRIWRFRLQNYMRWQCNGTPSPPSNLHTYELLCLMNFYSNGPLQVGWEGQQRKSEGWRGSGRQVSWLKIWFFSSK